MPRKKAVSSVSAGNKPDVSSIYALSGTCLGVKCYRGFASLGVLSKMSQPDEFHQKENPDGTQRDLSPKAAKDAYRYAKEHVNSPTGIWPEIILNIRNKDVVKIQKQSAARGPKDSEMNFVKIQIKWDLLFQKKQEGQVVISRVDGNHRLYYAGGDKGKQWPALDNVISPFCIIDSAKKENEMHIFWTINSKQRKLNVNHLLRLELQTSLHDELWYTNKSIWITNKLNEDTNSPFSGRIHKGGRKDRGSRYLINLKGLLDGINQLLSSFPSHTKLSEAQRIDLLSRIIDFYSAVKHVWPLEWEDSRTYKLMSNTGMQALGIIAGRLLEQQTAARNRVTREFFVDFFLAAKRGEADFWNKESDWQRGKSGRPGAVEIARELWDICSEEIEVQL